MKAVVSGHSRKPAGECTFFFYLGARLVNILQARIWYKIYMREMWRIKEVQEGKRAKEREGKKRKSGTRHE